MESLFNQLGLCGIIPVLTLEDARDAEPLGMALVEGGIPCVEVTFRTDAATDTISNMTKSVPGILVGAGTVQTVKQVKGAIDGGARFIVSPGLNRKVVEYCIEKKIPVIPGVVTPTEIEEAMSYGLDVLKFFPAEASGGVPFLKSITAPYKSIRFVPTGGVDESNLLSYLKLPGVLACGGSWMVKKELLAEKKFDEIKDLSAKAVRTMLGFKLQHVGIHAKDIHDAEKFGAFLAENLGFDANDTPGSIFIGSQFEILKKKGPGEHGHIAIGTNFADRAVDYFSRRGIKTKPETRSEKNGTLATVYLDMDIAGFAVHLIQL